MIWFDENIKYNIKNPLIQNIQRLIAWQELSMDLIYALCIRRTIKTRVDHFELRRP